jgi:hypothetical protein
MSGISIINGVGNADEAYVTPDHQLSVESVTKKLSHYVSHSKQKCFTAFMTYDDFKPVTVTNGALLYLANNDSQDMVITRLIGTVTGAAMFWVKKNVIPGTIANDNDMTPANLHFGSANPAASTCKGWDGVGTGMTGFTGGTKVSPLFIPGATVMDVQFSDTWIIPKGSNLLLEGKCFADTINVQMLITFYYSSAQKI